MSEANGSPNRARISSGRAYNPNVVGCKSQNTTYCVSDRLLIIALLTMTAIAIWQSASRFPEISAQIGFDIVAVAS